MSVNAINQDELQREVPKRETLARLYKYMFAYKKTLAAVLGLVAVTLAVSLYPPNVYPAFQLAAWTDTSPSYGLSDNFCEANHTFQWILIPLS